MFLHHNENKKKKKGFSHLCILDNMYANMDITANVLVGF